MIHPARRAGKGHRMTANPTTVPAADVGPKLDTARRELLDLGLRNALLNYRPLKSRGVEVLDELPFEVFRLLVRESRTMTFAPAKPAEAATQATLALPSAPEPEAVTGAVAARYTDRQLQTDYSADELRTRLLNTYYAARTFIE